MEDKRTILFDLDGTLLPMDMEKFIEMAEETNIWDPKETKGPGTSKRTTKNDYTRDEVAKMLDFARKFVSNKKNIESWEYGQDWLNDVGSTMKQFMTIKSGNPEYKEGEMDDMYSMSYNQMKGKKSGKADLNNDTAGPGPVRGSEIKTSIE